MCLGPACCTTVMRCAHLLWKSIAVVHKSPFLFPSSFVDSDGLQVFVFEIAQFVYDLLDLLVIRQ